MTGNLAIGQRQVPKKDQFGDEVKEQGMEKSIQNPGPEAVFLEEHTFLAQLVQLGISVEQPSGNVLIEDSHGKGREDSEKHVVEG